MSVGIGLERTSDMLLGQCDADVFATMSQHTLDLPHGLPTAQQSVRQPLKNSVDSLTMENSIKDMVCVCASLKQWCRSA